MVDSWFKVDRYSYMIKYPTAAAHGILCEGVEGSIAIIEFHDPPFSPQATEPLYPNIPGYEHVLWGTIFLPREYFPWYLDQLRNEVVWISLYTNYPEKNKAWVPDSKAGWGHLTED